MAIILSMYKEYADKILSGEKILEFRNNIGKDVKVGDTVYIYECKKYNGSGKVVGKFTINSFGDLETSSKWAGQIVFPYFLKNVIKNEDAYNAYNKSMSINLKHYNEYMKARYMFCPELIIKLDEDIDISAMRINHQNDIDRADRLINECENWLENIGFYDDLDNIKAYYKKYIEVSNPVRFVEKKDISEFKLKNGNTIQKAPQSWCYCKEK